MADGDDEDAFGDLEALLGGGDDGPEAASSGSEAEVEPEADDDDDLFGELASAFDAAPDEPEPEPEPEPELPAAVTPELPREPDRQVRCCKESDVLNSSAGRSLTLLPRARAQARVMPVSMPRPLPEHTATRHASE